MTHLGSQISALADGQLSPDAADRALAHVAGCPECRRELDAARAARRALSAAFEVPIAPDLTARLLALGACPAQGQQGQPPRRDTRFMGDSVPLPGSDDRRRLPADCLTGDLVRRRHVPGRWLVAATAGVGVAVVGLVSLGAQPPVVPEAHPAHALTLLGRASTSTHQSASVVPGSSATVTRTAAQNAALVPGEWADQATATPPDDALAWMAEHGWAAPDVLPQGYQVVGLWEGVDGSRAVEVDLVGEAGFIVVTEERGRLDPAVAQTAEQVTLGSRTVHVLSTAPWHGVWQSGDSVVSVVAEAPSDALDELVAAYPQQDYDDGLTARISRGFEVLAGTWEP